MADNWYQDSPIVEAPRAPAAPRPADRGSPAAQALGGPAQAQRMPQQPTSAAAPGMGMQAATAPTASPGAGDAWWEAAPVVQAPAAPAAAVPVREVGFLETAGRTALSAAIPIVRSIDMAAAGLAGMLAPMLGLNAEEEQAKIFRDAEERSARMRQQYEPQAGEQMSRAGQIAGGIASVPLEVTGGMGVQRGVERSADVLQRGGTLGEAGVAGGVTGAANVAANILPVKAGGAVGRAIESTLGRGLGARAGQVAGGALTGGAIGAAGDVGVTEASNLALPEGDQFADLQQESDPLTSFGLGAAFGGLGARAERRGGRRAAAAAGEVEQPMPAERAGATAPAGSVGAAGADIETQRRERAAALPVPIELSKGQATRRFEEQQFERETAKNAETGAPLREHFDEQNARLARNFDAFIDETGAEVTSPRGVGQAVDLALRKKLDERKAEINRAYDAAREAGDMAEPVKTDDLVAYLNETGPESINAPVLQTVREKLVQLGGAKRDGEGGLTAGEIPINDLEEIRKMINRVSDSTPTNLTFGREVKDRIDALTADAGGDLYREARRLRTNYGAEFNNRSVINDLVRTKRGTADRAVALEDVFDRSILRRSLDDVRHLRRVLQTAGDEGQQAWRELQGQTLRHLQDQALKGSGRDQRGNPIVSAAGLDRAVRELDADGRLEFIFGKKGAEQLRDLNDIAKDVLTSPPGSVNYSNTGSMLVNALDTMLTFSASGIPVPAFGVLRKAMTSIRERGVRKRVAQALEQPAGLAAPSDRPRFGSEAPEGAAETPGASPTEPARAAPSAGAQDPRLAEIARLRAATTNADALDVLDRRQRKVEAEIEADRAQTERRQQAEELDALARTSTDPELRKSLAARAEKLRGGAIPVGEATELPVETVQGAAEGDIPAGEATELPVDVVEPAPRPAEPARSAAGSDTEAELTLLQPGAPARGPKYKRAGSIDAVKEAWTAAGIKHSITDSGDTITVGQIVVPKEQRGQGVGTKAMGDLLAYADATGKRVVLSPSADFGGSKPRLVKFYKGLGFKENTGRSRDFTTRETMIRDPETGARYKRAGGPVESVPVFRGRSNRGPLRMRGGVAYFTDSESAARAYVENQKESGYDGPGVVSRATLTLKNPATEDDIRRVAEREGIELLHPDYPAAYLDGNPELVAALKAEGFDGAVGLDGRPDTGAEINTYAAFDPAQAQGLYKRAGEAPDTPEFRRWFGDSKVVDADGKPLVVYHGRSGDFEQFDVEGRGKTAGTGAFFTSSPAIAATYTGGTGNAANIAPAYLNLRNPLVVEAKGQNWNVLGKKTALEMPAVERADPDEALVAELEGRPANAGATVKSKAKKTTLGKLFPQEFNYSDGFSTDEIAAWARKQGFDGVIFRGVKDRGPTGQFHTEEAAKPADLYVAFNPEQIKSAIGNRGTFDPNDPSILNKQGGLPAKPFKQRRELEDALRAKLGHKLVDGLLQRNVITLGQAPADVPRDAQGRFTGSVVELYHDRLDAKTAPEVLMHEVGEHYGMPKMLGAERYAELMADVRKMRQRPEVSRIWDTVRRNYPGLAEDSPEFTAEVAAHMVESGSDRPIVRRMLDAPRAYLYRNFGVNVGRTDPALVRALAVGALRKSAGVEAVSPNPASLATAGARGQREDEAEPAQ